MSGNGADPAYLWDRFMGYPRDSIAARFAKAHVDHAYCGCCGVELVGGRDHSDDWCERCLLHVDTEAPPWLRTYSAQHGGRDCPWQEEG